MEPPLLVATKHEINAVQIYQTILGGSVELLSLLTSSLSSFEHLSRVDSLRITAQRKKAVPDCILLSCQPSMLKPCSIFVFFSFMWQCYISESCDHLVFCSISSLFRHRHVPSYILITDFLLLQCLIHCVTFSHVKVD